MIALFTLLLAMTGFALLQLAMARHQQDWLRRKLPGSISRTLRIGGFACLGLAFVVAGAGHGWDYGAVLWFGALSAGAALSVAANINRDRILRRAGRDKKK